MQKVVFLARRFYPMIGGVETHVLGLSRELVKKGYEVSIVTEQSTPALPAYEVYKAMQISRIPHKYIEGKYGIWSWIWKQRELFIKADIVHAHDVFWWLLPLLSTLPYSKRFTTFHGYEPDRLPGLRRKLHRKLVSRLSKRTLAIGSYIEDWYGIRADELSYGAFDATLRTADVTELKRFCFVGRIANDTGIETYVKFLSLLPYPITFDLYGDGDKQYVKKILKSLKRYGISHAFHGWTDEPEKAIASSDVVLSSQYLTMLTAMHHKRLVVSISDTPIKNDYLLCHPMHPSIVAASSAQELHAKFSSVTKNEIRSRTNNAHAWAVKQSYSHLFDIYSRLWL